MGSPWTRHEGPPRQLRAAERFRVTAATMGPRWAVAERGDWTTLDTTDALLGWLDERGAPSLPLAELAWLARAPDLLGAR